MAMHSNTLAWRIPWTEEPGGLQSMGSQRARHDWATSLYGLSSSHVEIWELHNKEGGIPKNWCFWTVVLEKTLNSPLQIKIKSVSLKGNKMDAEAKASILWPTDMNSWLIGKDPKAGKDWREKEGIEDEMVRWHHQFIEHELGQTPGDGEGHGSLGCCSPWGRKESDTTWWLNSNNTKALFQELRIQAWAKQRSCPT